MITLQDHIRKISSMKTPAMQAARRQNAEKARAKRMENYRARQVVPPTQPAISQAKNTQ